MARPPAGGGQPQLFPGPRAARQLPPNHTPPTSQLGTDGELEVPLSAHGRVLLGWLLKQGTQRPGASCHLGHTGKAYEAAWPGQQLSGQALVALSPSGISETYYVLGTVPESGVPPPSLTHIRVIPESQLLAPQSSQKALRVRGEDPNELLLITTLPTSSPTNRPEISRCVRSHTVSGPLFYVGHSNFTLPVLWRGWGWSHWYGRNTVT